MAVIGLTACKKLTSLADIQFNVPYTDTVEVNGLEGNPVVPSVGGIRASIPPIAVPTNSEENIRKSNTSAELIKEVKIGELSMSILQPGTLTFDIVDSIWLYMRASGLPDVLAAYSYDVPQGLRTLDLTTSDENIRDYFLKDTVFFRIEGRFYNAPDSNSVFSITTRFDAVANPLEQD